jgi:itaconyl-CoA hydratase
MTEKEGWNGRYYEDFCEGDVYRHPYGRTITETDNIWFTNLTLNSNQIHFNVHYASNTEFKKPLVNSCFTLALVTGLSVADVSQNGINLEWREVRMPHPLYVGDTVYAETEVLSKRESSKKPQFGIVAIKTYGINQQGVIVIEFSRNIMVYKKNFAPKKDYHPKRLSGGKQ